MNRTLPLTESLHDYLLQVGLREPGILRQLRLETASHKHVKMQIAPEQGQFMAFLARLTGVKRYLEVGVFTGYSSLAMALALPEDGEVTACDMSQEFTAIAREYWHKAGVSGRIQLHLREALETLDDLLAQGRADSYDMAFIDADKSAYPNYYQRALQLVRPGGLLLLDNMFMGGRVADAPQPEDTPGVKVIRQLNPQLRDDTRVDFCLLPLGDGLTLLRKR